MTIPIIILLAIGVTAELMLFVAWWEERKVKRVKKMKEDLCKVLGHDGKGICTRCLKDMTFDDMIKDIEEIRDALHELSMSLK